MVVQCRKRDKNGETTNDFGFFQKGWNEYKTGFGEIGSDYWIGLDTLHNMTSIEDTVWRLEVSLYKIAIIIFYTDFNSLKYAFIPSYLTI